MLSLLSVLSMNLSPISKFMDDSLFTRRVNSTSSYLHPDDHTVMYCTILNIYIRTIYRYLYLHKCEDAI